MFDDTLMKKWQDDEKSRVFEMVRIQDNRNCVVEVTVYIDENDHSSLIASFLVKSNEIIEIKAYD